jgi:plastocyanin
MAARWIAVVIGALAGPALVVLASWSQAAAGPSDVTVKLFQFSPNRLEVTRGTAVTWTNHDDIRHTVTSGVPERRDAKFDAVLPAKGATATVSFSEPGVYAYFCDRHQAMRGEIHVQ